MTPKCRYDCFHCPYPDCIVGVEHVSEEERERMLNQQRKVLRSVRIANGLTQQRLGDTVRRHTTGDLTVGERMLASTVGQAVCCAA